MKYTSFFILLFTITFSSCGQSKTELKSKDVDSNSGTTFNIIRADFAKILPHQKAIITDLTNSISNKEMKSLDSIWQNYYNTTKKGIATMILDSGRIKETDFNDFTQTIYETWTMSEKANAVYVIVSPNLKMARIFVGNSLTSFLSNKDVENIISNVILLGLNKESLYLTIRNMQLEIITKIRQNGG